ncbi:tryptophan 7-halogenase [Aquincola sp. S2]|uniref:Tryptophan 7-halogenase n=1 Tax=Pseudaquabacterium terrae TaxID=2732868 RepID=A0ABX2ECM2_9BURK|nr:tryptophan halogenase family protein [Aquabacterium terrae]NRF65567.1 tryptophan 7-halogenase [Aquabacterium terrae]
MATTATLFNYSFTFTPPAPKPGVPPTLKKIVIVGGGSAGWMTALILGNALLKSGVEITVLESPTVGIIGVGEGSTPWLRGFFDSLGIAESEWMPPCHATYKCGITFDGWSTKPGFEHYFHPFASMLDNLTMTQFVHNAHARIAGADLPAHPNRFFISAHLAERRLAPKPAYQFPFDVWYGYHFDAVLLGEFLHQKAVERGVRYQRGHIVDVQLDEQGDIASVRTQEGESIAADFFVDCTGFAALLIGKALNTPFVSFAENLFNDAAVAMPTPIGDTIPPQTVSTAMRHGWKWEIPLTNRYGNGYVYSSSFCSADEAERELRERLGLLDSDTPARHLKMRIGRVTKHWNRNCLAVGLSQGFIEPLEATALLFIQRTAMNFVEYVEKGEMDEAAQAQFNQRINDHFEGTRDYIVTHYKTNTRGDTDYWRANAANMNLSDELKRLFMIWLSGKPIAPEIDRQAIGRGYPVFSWYCILAGMGIFPEPQDLRAATASEARYSLDEIDNLLRRSAMNFRDHREVLADIPSPRVDKALQIYFW